MVKALGKSWENGDLVGIIGCFMGVTFRYGDMITGALRATGDCALAQSHPEAPQTMLFPFLFQPSSNVASVGKDFFLPHNNVFASYSCVLCGGPACRAGRSLLKCHCHCILPGAKNVFGRAFGAIGALLHWACCKKLGPGCDWGCAQHHPQCPILFAKRRRWVWSANCFSLLT